MWFLKVKISTGSSNTEDIAIFFPEIWVESYDPNEAVPRFTSCVDACPPTYTTYEGDCKKRKVLLDYQC